MRHDPLTDTVSGGQPPPNAGHPCQVSIIIKALNEEECIAATLESALRAVQVVGGEVILADSCSTDRTVDIARNYPVRIVQLVHADERCCGVGPQLGYQSACGEFLYLVDGDMQLVDGFLEQALTFMRSHPDIAGVGGRVLEMNLDGPEYQRRHEQWTQEKSGASGRLDCGGLYRRSAIEAVGYFSDRNLHSYEEFDLAARLRTRGWGLWRLPLDAVSHYGHDTPPYQLLLRRWRSRYLCGLGELLRASARGPRQRLLLAVQEIREIRLYTAVLMWWAVLLALLWLPASATSRAFAVTTLLLAPLALMTWRKRSLSCGVYAVIAWCFNAAGMVRGLLKKPRFSQPIADSRLLQDARPIQPRPSTTSTTASTT